MRLYAQAASIMQERLIELRINDAFEDGSFGRRLAYNTDTFNSLANGIDSFPKLQYLTLMRHDYIHIFDFDEYIDKCVTIKRLEIHVTIPFPNNDLDRVFYERRMVTDMSHIKQQNAISQLFVSLTLFNDDTLTYIIRKFPSLSTLDLACFDDNKRYRNVLPSLSKDVCLEFFSYISKIRDFRIMKLPIRNACGVLSSALINKIRSEKKSIVLKISYCSSGCIDIRTEPKNYIMTVELPFDRTESSLPHLQLLENLGDQVASLDIRLDHESYLDHNSTRAEDDVLVNMKKGNFLDHILENRSNLQRLDVTGPFLVHCSPHIQANKNLAHLSLTHCDIYLGLLPELSLQLPSLKQLEIDHCEVVSEDGTAFLKKPVLNVCMPQTSLDKITFRNPLSAAFVQGFCIKIEDHAGKETYYKRAHLETTVLTGPQAEHEYHLMRDGYLNIYIQCTSIKHISLFLFNIENEIDC
jgi:hypothetical protein